MKKFTNYFLINLVIIFSMSCENLYADELLVNEEDSSNQATENVEGNKSQSEQKIEDRLTIDKELPQSSYDQLIDRNILINDPINTYTAPVTTIFESQVFGINPYVGIQPKKLKYGQISVIPTVSIAVGYNDNLGLQNTSTVGSIATQLTPNIITSVDKGADKYTFTYTGNIYRYYSSSIDNRENHDFRLSAHNGFTRRTNLDWSIGYTDGSEERGFRDDTRIANLQSPNKFNSLNANVKYSYGANNARGNVDFSVGFLDKTYTSNTTLTAAGDIQSVTYTGNFNYRVAPKTYLTYGISQAETDFKLATANQDNTDTRHSVGLKWNGSSKSQLYLKIGRQNRDFVQSTVQDQSAIFHQIGVFWSPLSYSTIELYSGRGIVDGTISNIQNGLTSSNGFNWRHAWNKSFTSAISFNRSKTDFIGINDRIDTANAYGFYLDYLYKKNVNINLKFNSVNRTSSIETLGYDINVIMLGMNLSL